MRSFFPVLTAALAALACFACDGSVQDSHPGPDRQAERIYGSQAVKLPPATLAALGRKMFFDASLSASGRQSCASCHDPAHAFGAPAASAVQLGGAEMKSHGQRAVPSLRYLQQLPPFSEHFHENDGDDSQDQGPTGGHDWDGRADSLHGQAEGPLLAANEMANGSRGEVVAKLRRASYAGEFSAAFGHDIFDQPARAFAYAMLALEVYQQTPKEFYPYSSKFDQYLRGQVQLTPAEARGLRLFNDPAKGNCASCHRSAVTASGFPSFSDFGFVALGAPRNAQIPANGKADYYDFGLCGPLRTDLVGSPQYCGLFRTPGLRNVAVKSRYFHNGVFQDLEQVVSFYAQRDSRPWKWYPKGRAFNDLPARYQDNLYRDAPFAQQWRGHDALSSAEIRDIVAFLKTLTDADLLPGATSTKSPRRARNCGSTPAPGACGAQADASASSASPSRLERGHHSGA